MTRTPLIISSIIAALVLFASLKSPDKAAYSYHYENVLGTSFQLKVTADNESIALMAEETALNEIDRLSAILSSYDPQSEFSRWQKTVNQDIPVSRELFEVLSLFDQWRLKTHGALNASAGIAIATWQGASQKQQVPNPAELAQAASRMNQTHWLLNAEKQTARHLTTYPLVINTFAKSYIIDKATQRVMHLHGIADATIDIGGDLVVKGDHENHIRIVNPKATADNDGPLAIIKVKNKTVATSGNYRRGYRIQGDWYSHIIDARTAIPAREIISATVVSDNPTDAGAMATAFNLLTPAESAALARQFPGVEYLIITKSGKSWMSEHWKSLEEDGAAEKLTFASHAEKNDDEFEVTIELALARFEGRSRRPFVAVWVENKKKEVVRNVALWYNKPRWINELRQWYNKNSADFETGDPALGSITGATRSPGKYALRWDGTNSKGEAVESGKYTVFIEVAREHGTYQIIRQEINLNKKPQHFDLPGGNEITEASMDYHKVSQN